VRVLTLGCKVNQHESARLIEALTSSGCREAGAGEAADLCVVNTCAVTGRAEAESRRLIARARRECAGTLVATGCAVEADPTIALGCDLTVPNPDKHALAQRLLGREPLIAPDARRFIGRARATLKVQDGCNNACAYCIVPRLRGRSRSVPQAEVLNDLDRLAALGYPEVVLCAVHLGAYGADLTPQTSLPALLEAISGRIGEQNLSLRVRLSSLEPGEAMGVLPQLCSGTLCRHLHVSLQSGSDPVLARMRRRRAADTFRELALAASQAVPGLALGCDVIAGFPGESAEEFAETLALLEALPVSYLHVFPFSARPGTLAAGMPGQVSAAEKARRAAALRQLANRKRKAFYQSRVGSTVEVVLEGRDRMTGLLKGLSDNYVPVLVDSGGVRGGARRVSAGLMRVRIDRVVDSRVVATPL
jgi:threonylcarbamoyladenosine tRNA methylthiotransferase MtaB